MCHISTSRTKRTYFFLKTEDFCAQCLLQQNVGIVCRHFFYMMRKDLAFRFHIQLVRRRWFKDEWQDEENPNLTSRPFLFASKASRSLSHASHPSHSLSRVNDLTPSAAYMSSATRIFPEVGYIPAVERGELSRRRRHANLHSSSKEPVRIGAEDPGIADLVSEGLRKLEAKVQSIIESKTGRQKVRDSIFLPSTGKVSSKRILSRQEISMGFQEV